MLGLRSATATTSSDVANPTASTTVRPSGTGFPTATGYASTSKTFRSCGREAIYAATGAPSAVAPARAAAAAAAPGAGGRVLSAAACSPSSAVSSAAATIRAASAASRHAAAAATCAA